MIESSPRPAGTGHRFSVPGLSAWVVAAGFCGLASLAPGLQAQEPAAQEPKTPAASTEAPAPETPTMETPGTEPPGAESRGEGVEPAGPPVPNAAADPDDEDLCAELRARAAADPAAALDGFEGKLKEHPDDLRCGNGYRRAVIATESYPRAIDFFKALVEAHPQASNAYLNLGYALVDKIPSEGAITQVLLANEALGHFSKAIELKETWVGLYTRGNSYLFWPPIFGRTASGMADLERAVAMSKKMEKREHHARAWAALGDGHWRLDDLEQARATWQQGAKLFPGNPHLEARLGKSEEELAAFLDGHFDANNRVDTDLEVLWEGGP